MGKRYDIDYIKQCARGQWEHLLPAIAFIPSELLDGKHHPCPKCGGTDRFRCVDLNEGACLCNQCFSTRNGDGIATIQWYLGLKFIDAVKAVAEELGIKSTESAKPEKRDPAKHLEFLEWNELTVARWCADYAPIKPESLKLLGAKCALYRKAYPVIAVPIWGVEQRSADPVGWVILSKSGAPVFTHGANSPPEMKRKFTSPGSRQGMIIPEGIDQAEEIWKTEGPTDLAALLSTDLPKGVSACCNAMGAGEKPLAWMAQLFEGKLARVIHDADIPGQRGALLKDGDHFTGWAPALAVTAKECRNVQLPYSVAETKGRDLRDFLAEGKYYSHLVDLVTRSDPVKPNLDILKPEAKLAPDDPIRLAKVNLARYAASREGGTLRCWRDEFYKWDGKSYRRISKPDLRARIMASIQEEFERLNVDEQEDESTEKLKFARKVNRALVSNVIDATASLCLIPETVEPLTWIDGEVREQRDYIAMENGILDLGDLLDGGENPLRDHSPKWFSTICLPYSFDPEADCPTWKAILRRNLGGNAEYEKTLQEWAGYLLRPETGQQRFLVLEGEGANGKSVIMAALTAMLGEQNCSHIPLELFGDRFAKTQTLGKLVNISADVGELDKVAEGYLKSFTSGDIMFFDRKGIEGVDCTPTARLMMACNNRPRWSDKSDGLWRRMLLISFLVQITEQERIPNMDKIWWWEESGELPGIFNWALKGLWRLRTQQNFTIAEESRIALADYQDEVNPTRRFIREHIIGAENGRADCQEVYDGYRFWCKSNGYHHLGNAQFGKELYRRFKGCTRRRGKKIDDSNNTIRYYFYDGVAYLANGVPNEEDELFHGSEEGF